MSERTTLWQEIKLLLKFYVLIANVMPILTGFSLALYVLNFNFYDYWLSFLLTIVGSTLVIAGALIINNWYDIDIDSVMRRTKNRPTVTGSFSQRSVLFLGIILSILGFIFLVFVNWEVFLYSFIGWVTYVFLYTMWSKRKYTLNTIIGSLSGAVTPLMGWAIVNTAIHIIPLSLFLLLFIWQVPHTFAITIKRCDEYREAGVPMLPVVYGFEVTKRQMFVYIICLLPIPFFMLELGVIFLILATALNLGWTILALTGFYIKDDIKWAQHNFLYSVNYLLIIFLYLLIMPIFQ